ncbi:MAG: hypothetical protein MJ088_05685, partial [Clostridia bacterium]|nr:hypothetical protein [Clostridia bacterium]
ETEAPIVDNFSKAFTELGLTMGYASGHGNNQTRIAYTSSGVYVSCPTDDFDSDYDPYAKMNMYGSNYVLYVIRPDGTKELLVQDKMFWVDAGTTTNVMVDKNEDIWVVTSWDEGSKHYPMIAWHYDVSEDKVTKYEEMGFVAKGGSYGKPYYIMDTVNNKIYLVTFAWTGYGRIMWTTFDIETKTWDKNLKCQRAPCSCCYHFGYPDGKGGFYFVTSRTVDNMNTASNIEGMNVQQAMNKFQNRRAIDVNQVWDETYLFYIPDPSTDTFYCTSFGPAEYDVEKGIYPLLVNRESDVYLNEDTGLFYVLREEEDCGRIGRHMMLYIFDTNGRVGELSDDNIFPMICKKEVSFSYGVGVHYFPRMVKDLEGNLYIVVGTERAGEIEIWRATDEIGSEYEFVYTGGVDEYYNDKRYSEWRSLISATNRNNSTASDTIYFLYECDYGWESFSIDFAALRAKYGL